MHPESPVFSRSKSPFLLKEEHRQIVDGACKLFLEKGYHPATIRDIAKASGMSMGQLYDYIASKSDVLYLVHQYIQRVWYHYLQELHIERIAGPKEKLTRALHHSMLFMVENKKLVQFVYSESKYLDKKYLRSPCYC